MGVLVAFVLIVLLIGTMMPRGFETSSSVVIKAPPEVIFPQINNIKMWANWSMWNEHDIPGLKVEYSGPDSGVGAVQKWTEKRGEGKLWITESLENEVVNFTSIFAHFPESQSSITLTPGTDGVRVEWKSEGALPGGPFYGWFGMTFSDSLAREYKKALKKLKRHCEIQVQGSEKQESPGETEEENSAND